MKILLILIFLLAGFFPAVCGEFDFGSFMANEAKSHTFKITNTSGSELRLGKIRSSCGCTEAAYSDSTLLPGETADFSVTLKANSLSGAFAKTLYVETNDAKQKFLRFVLRGEAIPLVAIAPDPLLFAGTLELGITHEYQFILTPTGSPVELELADHEYPAGVSVVLKPKGKIWIAIVNITPTEPESIVNIKWTVQVKKPAGWPDMEFIVNGKTQSTPAESPAAEKTAR